MEIRRRIIIVCVVALTLVVLMASLLWFFSIRYAVKEGEVRGKIKFGLEIYGQGRPVYLVDSKGQVYRLSRTTNEEARNSLFDVHEGAPYVVRGRYWRPRKKSTRIYSRDTVSMGPQSTGDIPDDIAGADFIMEVDDAAFIDWEFKEKYKDFNRKLQYMQNQ
jgi:hypothetical protein